jgi:hypothetical protein
MSSLIEHAVDLGTAYRRLADPQHPFGRWCVPQLIASRGLSVIYGPDASYKTLLLCGAAVSIAAGLPWAGRPVEAGGVLYIASEDHDGVGVRLAACATHHGIECANLPITIAPMWDLTVHSPAFVDETVELGEKLRRDRGVPVRAVILDTLGGAFGGGSQDESGLMTSATGALLEVGRRLDCAAVAVHHTGKDQHRGARGSKVLRDRADVAVRLDRRGHAVVEKVRNGPVGAFTFTPAAFDLAVPGREPLQTLVLSQVRLDDAREPPRPSPVQQQRTRRSPDLEIVQSVICTLAPHGEPISKATLRTACYEAFGDRREGAKRTAFNKSLDRLADQGALHDDDGTITVSVSGNVSDSVSDKPSADGSSVSVSDSSRPLLEGRSRADAHAQGQTQNPDDEDIPPFLDRRPGKARSDSGLSPSLPGGRKGH